MSNGNLENCIAIKADYSHKEAIKKMTALANMIKSKRVGIGVWEGDIKGKISGVAHTGKHVAVFDEHDLLAPFGPRGDQESEAAAALFAMALTYIPLLGQMLAIDDELNNQVTLCVN